MTAFADLRRPAAGYGDARTLVVNFAALPLVRPAAERGFEWNRSRCDRWTAIDLLLVPVALWLAAGWPAGMHRRYRMTSAGRHRRPVTRTRTARTGGTR